MFVIGYFGAKHRDVNQLAFFVFFGGLCTLGSGLVSVLYFLELFSGEMSASEQKECDLDPACTEEMKSGGMRTHPIVRACPPPTTTPFRHLSSAISKFLRESCMRVVKPYVVRGVWLQESLSSVGIFISLGCAVWAAVTLMRHPSANRDMRTVAV